MEQKNMIALMSRITELTNRMIVDELKMRGIQGIVPSHGGILVKLFSGRQYTMQEMAAAIHRTKPTVTVLVAKLEEQGYVQRTKSPEDSRVTLLHITEQGRAMEPVFQEVSAKLNALVYQGLTEEKAQAMTTALRQILERLAEEH